ncbi:MAG: 3-methyl-2-oxobutanoate hydroxymethyltransferase [Phycisphaeraceae bacterium]|nr:3-methyl-2-oxobutanoate hydroxymethyltransferase [Phycisphaeraceae bacterium]
MSTVGSIIEGASRKPVTLATLGAMAARGEAFACLTCYDASTARLLEQAGVHLLLVGDTAAEVVLGLPRTIDMPLDVLLALTAAVKRGAPHTVVMGDMPFMSYQASPDKALENAGRFLVEGKADIVKLEADASYAPLVQRMTSAGIPVCAHVGSKPQHVALTSGYKAQGRTREQAEKILADAAALESAGAAMLLVEAVPTEVADAMVERARVPVIGIGAGPNCHGQVVVLHDVMGLLDKTPGLARPVANLGPVIREAAMQWVRSVAERDFGGKTFTMRGG